MCKKKYRLLKNKSRKQSSHPFPGVLLLAVILLFSGCARKYPATFPLDTLQQRNARSFLQKIRHRARVQDLDADVAVSWEGYGRKYHFNATLQATGTGRFRLSGLDPFGRPLFILVTDGTTFTLVDNRQGRGYVGPVDSTFLHKYIPPGVQLSTCFSLLTAQFPDAEVQEIRLAQDKKNYWFIFTGRDGAQRRIEVILQTGLPVRQVLVNAEGDIILDVRYEDYQLRTAPLLPSRLRMEGGSMPGSLKITLNKVYREKLLPETIFTLAVPVHFRVVHVK